MRAVNWHDLSPHSVPNIWHRSGLTIRTSQLQVYEYPRNQLSGLRAQKLSACHCQTHLKSSSREEEPLMSQALQVSMPKVANTTVTAGACTGTLKHIWLEIVQGVCKGCARPTLTMSSLLCRCALSTAAWASSAASSRISSIVLTPGCATAICMSTCSLFTESCFCKQDSQQCLQSPMPTCLPQSPLQSC